MDVPPQQPRTVVVVQEPGMGCFAKGCLTLVVIAFFAIVALVGCGWYFMGKAIDMFTSPAPMNIALEVASDADFTAADTKLNQLRDAARNHEAVTLTFSGPEINALIQRHPDFASRRGTMRVTIADSMATVEMSMPLAALRWGKVRHRWFNGSASFTFLYAAQQGFSFDTKWIEANGHRLTRDVLRYGEASFNQSFSAGFEETTEQEGNGDFWRNVKTMTLDRDQLVVITKGEKLEESTPTPAP